MSLTAEQVAGAMLQFAVQHDIDRFVFVHALADLTGMAAAQMARDGDLVSFDDRMAAFADQARAAYQRASHRAVMHG